MKSKISRLEKKRKPRKCNVCGQPFKKSNKSTTRYCSPDCKKTYNQKRNKVNREIADTRLSLALDTDIEWLVKYRMNKIRGGAKRRGLEFNLSYVFVKNFFKSNCYYCGDKLHIVSFDRVESSLGYTPLNVVPCCWLCNQMKLTTNKNDFISKCKAIASNF